MKKLMMLNAVALVIFIIPILLTKSIYFQCTASVERIPDPSWKASKSNFRQAAGVAIAKCKKNSEVNGRCVLQRCENRLKLPFSSIHSH